MEQILEQAKTQLEYLRPIRKVIEKRLKYALPGSLSAVAHHKGYQFYWKVENKRRYIPQQDIERKKKLAQKEYDRELLHTIDQKINALEYLLNNYPDISFQKIYAGMHNAKKSYINPIEITDDEFISRWKAIEYQGKRFAEDDKTEYFTAQGERVRSKSEIIIADLLNQYRIPYRYEFPLVFAGGECTVYPDFTALNVRSRKEYIFEHFGRMSDPIYANNVILKLSTYIENGYYPGENLLFTYESMENPLRIRTVKKLIEHYLL